MRALRLKQWKSDAVLEEVPVPEPGPGEVLIEVGAAGACHSDLHLMHEFEPGILPWAPPFTLGHENAGWVHTLGEGVTGLEVGQPVAVVGAWGCGSLRALPRRAWRPTANAPTGRRSPAAAAASASTAGWPTSCSSSPRATSCPLPDGLEVVDAAPLTDAALTPYHAVRRSLGKLRSRRAPRVVIGVGGLGHLAVQVLKAVSAARVIAIDGRDEAREHAATLGADLALAPGSGHRRRRCARPPFEGRGADVVLDFVGLRRDARDGRQRACARWATSPSSASPAAPCRSRSSACPTRPACRRPTGATAQELVEVLDLAARGLLRADDDDLHARGRASSPTTTSRTAGCAGGRSSCPTTRSPAEGLRWAGESRQQQL